MRVRGGGEISRRGGREGVDEGVVEGRKRGKGFRRSMSFFGENFNRSKNKLSFSLRITYNLWPDLPYLT